jgi:F0F1-type ATP synthase assembly protein I
MNGSPNIPLMDRVRFIGYGLIAGLVFGAVLGWMFHGWVGFIFKLFIVAMLLVPLVLAVLFWQRVTSRPAAPRQSDVRDADWIEIEADSRSRR